LASAYDLQIVVPTPYGCVTRKMAVMEGGLFRLDVNKGYSHRDVFSGQVDLAYDIRSKYIQHSQLMKHLNILRKF